MGKSLRQHQREAAKKRLANMTEDERHEYQSAAGKALWAKLTPKQRAERIAKMVAGQKRPKQPRKKRASRGA